MTIKIAENLQLLRKEKGLTQEELSEVFGVTSQSISKWELGLSCPDITILPKIAEYYQISIDELLGYKPMSSINSIYIQMKAIIDDAKCNHDMVDYVYRISRLAVTTLWNQQHNEVDKLIKGNKTNTLSFGQNDGGVTICADNSVFVCSFKDYPKYDITTIRKVSKYLNKISDLNTLKVLFVLFEMMLNNSIRTSWTIKEIQEYSGLEETSINKAFNDLDIYLDQEEYTKTGIEKYSLEHVEQVPLLIAMLIPVLHYFNDKIKD